MRVIYFCLRSVLLSYVFVVALPAHANDACLAFDPPDQEEILSSNKKVFANYFLRHPLSFENTYRVDDYYSRNYLQPHGEKDKWLAQGGFLRSRPLLTRPSLFKSQFKKDNLKREIRLALSRGINGFVFDALSVKDVDGSSYLGLMLDAVSEVDPRFKIVISPSVSSLKGKIKDVRAIIEAVYDNKDPSLYRTKDGRLVIAPFNPEVIPIQDWKKLMLELKEEGKHIAFLPFFLSAKDDYLAAFESISFGFGTWGTAYPNRGDAIDNFAQQLHAQHKIYMAGLQPQGYRPKNFLYWEPEGSKGYRNSWEGAIKGKADLIQLVTWNDFSESTQVSPYTDLSGSSGTGFFNLTGYYAAWFHKGSPPPITHDVLYYFYRKHPINADAPQAKKKTRPAFKNIRGVDLIEVVGFLTAPGKLSVTIGKQQYSKEVEAGVQSFEVPLTPGVPVFSLERGGKPVLFFKGTTKIYGQEGLSNGFADFTYWSGSASSSGTCFSDALEPYYND